MDTYKLKFTRLQNEILRLLCIKVGEDLNQRAIARLLNVSPTAIAKAIKTLEEEKLIKINKRQTMNLISIQLNRENIKVNELKRIENLKQIYESELVECLENSFPGCTIILFGSYSLGEDTINSDIDIAILESKEKQIKLTKFEEILERKISVNYYKDLKNIKKNLKGNILNGIILRGSIEL